MKNDLRDGRRLQYTPSGFSLVSGQFFKMGVRIACALVDIPDGSTGVVVVKDVKSGPKEAPLVISQGDALYWDDTAKKFTKTSSSNTLAGYAAAPALSADTTVSIALNA